MFAAFQYPVDLGNQSGHGQTQPRPILAHGIPYAGRAALGFLFKRKLPPVRRIHADDPAMAMVVSNSVG